YKPVPWDNVYLPGWQPMSSEEGTMAEALVQRGYHTGFFSDVPHYFVPGMNFTRGFGQWAYIRGHSEDRYRATAHADPVQVARYWSKSGEERVRAHLANVRPYQPEEEWPTARTFRAAIEFVEQNQRHHQDKPFYLYVDSFAPHESWEAPIHYYDLYESREKREPICITVPYGPLNLNPQLEERLPSIRANYAGLVTLVDTWFGKLIDTIDRLGLAENTMIFFVADHGTNFAENPDGVTGKPADYMYPGTMDLPLLVRHPTGVGAGTQCGEFVYTLDIPATISEVTGVVPVDGIEGQSLLPLVTGEGAFQSRAYLTCRYGNSVWYKDRQNWFFSDAEFQHPRLFDFESDPDCHHEITDKGAERIETAKTRILDDAGGLLRVYRRQNSTDAIGRPEFK
ncbi:MAG: sulfatase-like hydrolase/transferase, partial [Chloroflexota bacterium]